MNLSEFDYKKSEIVVDVNNLKKDVNLALNFLYFSDCNYFWGHINISKKTIIISLVENLYSLKNYIFSNKEVLFRNTFTSNIGVTLLEKSGYKDSLGLFNSPVYSSSNDYKNKFCLFLIHCFENKYNMIPNKSNFKAMITNRIVMHLIGGSKDKFILTIIKKQYDESLSESLVDVKQVPGLINTKSVESSFLSDLNKKSGIIEKKLLSKRSKKTIDLDSPSSTLNFRELINDEKNIIRNMNDFMNLLEIPKINVSKRFSLENFTSYNAVQLCKLLKLPLYLIIFSCVKVETQNSARSYNVNWIDSYSGGPDRLVFILKSITHSGHQYSLLSESEENHLINMKVYISHSTPLIHANSVLMNMNPRILKKRFSMIDTIITSSTQKKNESDFQNAEMYKDYLDMYENYNDKTLRVLRVVKFNEISSFLNVLESFLNIKFPTDDFKFETVVDFFDKYSSIFMLSDMNTCYNFFLINDPEFLKTKQIFISESYTIYMCRPSIVRTFVINRELIAECIIDTKLFNLKMNIPLSSKNKFINNFLENDFIKQFYDLFNFSKSNQMLNSVKDIKLFGDKKTYNEFISFIKSTSTSYTTQENAELIDSCIKKILDSKLILNGKDWLMISDRQNFYLKRNFYDITNDENKMLIDYLSRNRFVAPRSAQNMQANLLCMVTDNFENVFSTTSPIPEQFSNSDHYLTFIMESLKKMNFNIEFAILEFDNFIIPNYRDKNDISNIKKTPNFNIGDSIFSFNKKTLRLEYLRSSKNGNIKFDMFDINLIEIIDYQDAYKRLSVIKSKFMNATNDKNSWCLNFVLENPKIVHKDLTNSNLYQEMLYIDSMLLSVNGKPLFDSYYKLITIEESLTEDKTVLNQQKTLMTQNFAIIEKLKLHLDDNLNQLWSKWTYTEDESAALKIITNLASEKKLEHPAKNINLAKQQLYEYVTHDYNIEKERTEIMIKEKEEKLKELAIIKEEKNQYLEIFAKDLKMLRIKLNELELTPTPSRDFQDYVYQDLKLRTKIYKFNRILAKREYLDKQYILEEDVFNREGSPLQFVDFLESFNKKLIKQNESLNKGNKLFKPEELAHRIIFSDKSLLYFSNMNESINKMLKLSKSIDYIKNFIVDYTKFANKLFESWNSRLQVSFMNMNYSLLMKNFMTWTKLRHDIFSYSTILLMLTNTDLEIDINLGSYFSNLSRTPDILLFSKNKRNIFIIEFTYSHKNDKGFISKGYSLETSKYYPEIYSIYMNNDIDNIIYLPLVFSQYLNNPNNEMFNTYKIFFEEASKLGFDINISNFELWVKTISELTDIFLTSTDLIYKPDKLFNFLISRKNYYSIQVGEKYNCVEYNPEMIDTLFENSLPVRNLFHMIFGKYIYANTSKDTLIETIINYNMRPIEYVYDDEDLSSEIFFSQIPVNWLIKIFNESLASFSHYEFNLIHSGSLLFSKELIRRVDRYLNKYKPEGTPFFADGVFILNEFYNRMMNYQDLKYYNCLLNKTNCTEIRTPKDDITGYYKKLVVMKEKPDIKVYKKRFLKIDENEMRKQLELVNKVMTQSVDFAKSLEINHIKSLINSVLANKTSKKDLIEFIRKFGYKIKEISDFPQLDDNIEKWIISKLDEFLLKSYNIIQKLKYFSDLTERLIIVLHENHIIIPILEECTVRFQRLDQYDFQKRKEIEKEKKRNKKIEVKREIEKLNKEKEERENEKRREELSTRKLELTEGMTNVLADPKGIFDKENDSDDLSDSEESSEDIDRISISELFSQELRESFESLREKSLKMNLNRIENSKDIEIYKPLAEEKTKRILRNLKKKEEEVQKSVLEHYDFKKSMTNEEKLGKTLEDKGFKKTDRTKEEEKQDVEPKIDYDQEEFERILKELNQVETFDEKQKNIEILTNLDEIRRQKNLKMTVFQPLSEILNEESETGLVTQDESPKEMLDDDKSQDKEENKEMINYELHRTDYNKYLQITKKHDSDNYPPDLTQSLDKSHTSDMFDQNINLSVFRNFYDLLIEQKPVILTTNLLTKTFLNYDFFKKVKWFIKSDNLVELLSKLCMIYFKHYNIDSSNYKEETFINDKIICHNFLLLASSLKKENVILKDTNIREFVANNNLLVLKSEDYMMRKNDSQSFKKYVEDVKFSPLSLDSVFFLIDIRNMHKDLFRITSIRNCSFFSDLLREYNCHEDFYINFFSKRIYYKEKEDDKSFNLDKTKLKDYEFLSLKSVEGIYADIKIIEEVLSEYGEIRITLDIKKDFTKKYFLKKVEEVENETKLLNEKVFIDDTSININLLNFMKPDLMDEISYDDF